METQPTITTQNTTLAVIGDDDPFTAYANAMAPRNIVGTLLRFSKGDYLAGEEGAAVPGGTMMTANVGELLVGWVLFTYLLNIGDQDKFDLGGIIGAIIGTMLVLLVLRAIRGRSAAGGPAGRRV